MTSHESVRFVPTGAMFARERRAARIRSHLPLSRDLAGLALWLLATFAAGGIGAFGSAGAPEFYAQLAKPGWAPPAGVFGPVWTALYVLIGVSGWLAWRERRLEGSRLDAGTYGLFAAQLAVNALWSWLFFAWHNGALAFVDVLLLDALIVATMLRFRAIRIAAALLLLPYLAWVCFASALTMAVWRANPGLL